METNEEEHMISETNHLDDEEEEDGEKAVETLGNTDVTDEQTPTEENVENHEHEQSELSHGHEIQGDSQLEHDHADVSVDETHGNLPGAAEHHTHKENESGVDANLRPSSVEPVGDDEDLGGSPSNENAVLGTCNQQEDVLSDIEQKSGHSAAQANDLEQRSLDDQPAHYQAVDEQDLTIPHDVGHVSECRGIPTPPPLYVDNEDAALSSSDDETSPCILNMLWSFGINKKIPVQNLSTDKVKAIFYACSNVGIIYHFVENKQMILQGHSNALSCMCTSEDRRWLVTADRGPNSLVIVWDANTGMPIKTIFDCETEGGCTAVALTRDARYLATLTTAADQTLAIWDWTSESDVPICTAQLQASYGVQTYLFFNPDDITQLVSNSTSQVIFYRWFGGKIDYFAPPLTDHDFNKPVGVFSNTIFCRNSSRALSATSLGNLVVWEANKMPGAADNVLSPDKRALKIVRVQDRAISVLTVTDDYIVAADLYGSIKFFDQHMKMVHGYQDLHLGPISSLSFSHTVNIDYSGKSGKQYPTDSTIDARVFVVRDFIVSTTTGVVANITVDGTDIKVLLKEHDEPVHAVAVHPTKAFIVIGSYSGMLKLWQYNTKEVVTTRVFDRNLRISCCAYDPKGHLLAIGFTNGNVRIVDALSLEDCMDRPFDYCRRDSISQIIFSHNGQYLATADTGFAISLYERSSSRGVQNPYKYVGRYRAHYETIRDICFGVKLDSDKPRLLSLGEDRMLVEYDLENTSLDDIRILSSDRIEQSAVPHSMLWYPQFNKESFLLTANSAYKFKLYNSTTKMCRKTLLGPTYGSPIQKMILLPSDKHSDQQYLAYMIENKVGLVMLPLTGNPHRAAALIAHPQGVSDIMCSSDGKYLFTVGGKDLSVNMWKINFAALEAQARLGGEDLIPFFGLMEGGEDGELVHEMEDYFYYSQLRSQGINVQDTRQVSEKIPLSEIPFVVRALGYYPTEQEVEEMLNEVKFGNYVETGQYETEIDLSTFIKLYVNHRPAFGLEPDQVRWAFDVLASALNSPDGIHRSDLLHLLQTRGEQMTEVELAEHLGTLLGYSPDADGCGDDEFPPIADIFDQRLPERITADMFAARLLGFESCTNRASPSNHDGVDAVSQLTSEA